MIHVQHNCASQSLMTTESLYLKNYKILHKFVVRYPNCLAFNLPDPNIQTSQ